MDRQDSGVGHVDCEPLRRGSQGAAVPSGLSTSLAAPARSHFRRRAQLPDFRQGRYRIHFAASERDLARIQRLRFEVFNLELGEGFDESYSTGRDRDAFDEPMDHLLVTDERLGELVGTYRMQTLSMAQRGIGFYCEQEFDLSQLPAQILSGGVEAGRACVAQKHRNGKVLFALWRGLAAYMRWNNKQYLFGCSSLTSQDPRQGQRMLWQLRRDGFASKQALVDVREAFACAAPADFRPEHFAEVDTPRLFRTYLRHGATIQGGPALDREFKTIDFLILLSLESIPRNLVRLFFLGLPEPKV